MNPNRAWPGRRVILAFLIAIAAVVGSVLILREVLSPSDRTPRKAVAQAARDEPNKAATPRNGDAEEAPKSSKSDERPDGDPRAPKGRETPKARDIPQKSEGTNEREIPKVVEDPNEREVSMPGEILKPRETPEPRAPLFPVKEWGETFPAYDYHPPIDILDRRVHVVLDAERVRILQSGATSLEIDPAGGRFYWCEGGAQVADPGMRRRGAHLSGRLMRARLDGTRVETLAADRAHPRDLVLDAARGRIYWLEGTSPAPCMLHSATLDGKDEKILSRGLDQPFGLALDPARRQLYYGERTRLDRINVDGTGEEVVTANTHIVYPALVGLTFDPTHDRLYSAFGQLYRWFDRDGTHLACVPRMEPWANIRGIAFDAEHQKIYFAVRLDTLARANPDFTQVEFLVASPNRECADGFQRSIVGDVALDLPHGQIWWTGARGWAGTVCRTDIRPLPEPTSRPAPPKIAAIAPAEQAAGGEVTLSGDGLAGAVAVAFIDDSTGAHVPARFRPTADGRLTVTFPQLAVGCRRPVIVVRSPNGVTMTPGSDVLAPTKRGGLLPYEDVRSIALDGSNAVDGSGTHQYERSVEGNGRRLLLRPGVRAGNVEVAIVYAMRGSLVAFGPKGMVTAFAEDDSYVGIPPLGSEIEAVIYHEPFAVIPRPIHHDSTVKLIPVPAIRASFPEEPFRYQASRPPAD